MNENATAVDLDSVDLRLLGLLQADASRSNLELAELAHVSPATCLRRVKRMVEAGVIELDGLDQRRKIEAAYGHVHVVDKGRIQ